MKYDKALVPVAVSVAVVFAAIAAIVVTNNRATTARARAAEAESLEIAADKQLKEARANEAAAAAQSAATAAELKKSEAERDAVRDGRAKSEADAKIAAEETAKAKLEAEAARLNAEVERNRKASEQAKAEAAKAELERETARIAGELALSNAAVAEAVAKLEGEKRRTEAVIAEAKLKELRKIDFERIERELIEYKQELDERERALHPDVSIYESSNVTWVADREAEVIGGDSNRLLRAVKVLPENDLRLSAASRALAKQNRILYESQTNRTAVSRAKLIATFEKLRDDAQREGRTTDAKFFQKSLKSLYPDYQQ